MVSNMVSNEPRKIENAFDEVFDDLQADMTQAFEESLRTEYGALRLRLEGELLRFIAEQSSRAGSAHP